MHQFRLPYLLPVLLCPLASVSCAGTGGPEEPGRGIIAISRDVPEGAEAVERPVWTKGDHFVHRKGGQFRYEFRVVEADETGYVLLDENSGARQKLTRDLAETERGEPDEGLTRRKDPFDAELTWPLWVGKRWTCHYVDRIPGRDGLAITADYHCDRTEEIQTRTGAFRCFRIWRNARLNVPGGSYFDNSAVFWYSPEVGWFVRRLDDGMLRELESYHRQGPDTRDTKRQ